MALPGFPVHGILQQEHWSGLPCPPLGDLSNPGTEPRSPILQANSSPSELPGKPKNTGVGSLSLLQGIFLTQESNQGLLHCRQILYQLSYQRSPEQIHQVFKIVRLLEMKVQWWLPDAGRRAELGSCCSMGIKCQYIRWIRSGFHLCSIVPVLYCLLKNPSLKRAECSYHNKRWRSKGKPF